MSSFQKVAHRVAQFVGPQTALTLVLLVAVFGATQRANAQGYDVCKDTIDVELQRRAGCLNAPYHPSKEQEATDAIRKSEHEAMVKLLHEGMAEAAKAYDAEYKKREAEAGLSNAQLADDMKKAQAGDAEAQYIVGSAYLGGNGVNQDLSAAIRWLRMSALQGNAKGERALGCRYLFGQGVNQNYSLVLNWLIKAASQGDTNAMNNLGDIYYGGKGLLVDKARAFEYYMSSANAGNPYGQKMVGMYYAFNLINNVKQDYSIAFSWYSKAADQGDSNAEFLVGSYYASGLGVEKDYRKAGYWLDLALHHNYFKASEALSDLEKF